MRKRKAAAFAIAAGLCLTVSGCQKTAQTGRRLRPQRHRQNRLRARTQAERQRKARRSAGDRESLEETTEEETQAETGEEPLYEIVLATDIHYLGRGSGGQPGARASSTMCTEETDASFSTAGRFWMLLLRI